MSTPSANARIVQQISMARRELLDLGLRNPLLNYRTSKARGADIVRGRSADIFDLLMRQGKAIGFLGAPEPQNDEAERPEPGSDRGSNLLTPYTEKVLQSRLLKTHY